MNDTYTTVQGDAWDIIAKKVYGSELYADFLMKNNLKYIDVFIFDEGTILNTPENNFSDNMLPEWRQ